MCLLWSCDPIRHMTRQDKSIRQRCFHDEFCLVTFKFCAVLRGMETQLVLVSRLPTRLAHVPPPHRTPSPSHHLIGLTCTSCCRVYKLLPLFFLFPSLFLFYFRSGPVVPSPVVTDSLCSETPARFKSGPASDWLLRCWESLKLQRRILRATNNILRTDEDMRWRLVFL